MADPNYGGQAGRGSKVADARGKARRKGQAHQEELTESLHASRDSVNVKSHSKQMNGALGLVAQVVRA